MNDAKNASPGKPSGDGLERFFKPSGIAVVGASDDVSKPGGRSLHNLKLAYSGQIVAVHPRQDVVQDIPAFPTAKDIPPGIDMALLFVSAEQSIDAIRGLAGTAVHSAVVFAAGFDEVGNEMLLQRLAEAGRDAGVRLLGPNCAGIWDYHERYQMGFSPGFSPQTWRPGGIGLAIQGGGLARSLSQGEERMEGFSWIISLGNEADIQAGDAIRFLADDPNTTVIATLLEGVRDGGRFRDAVMAAHRAGKPVVALKVGRTDQGARATGLHTGALAGDERVFAAAMHDLGVRVAADLDDFYGLLSLLARYGEPARPGLAVATFSGGAASLCADIAQIEGLRLPEYGSDLEGRLAELVPEFANVANPLDLTGVVYAKPSLLRDAVAEFIEQRDFGAVAVAIPMHYDVLVDGVAVELALLQREVDLPLIAIWMSQGRSTSAVSILEGGGVHVFLSATVAMRVLKRYLDAAYVPRNAEAKVSKSRRPNLPRDWFGDGVLREYEVSEICRTYGLEFAPYELIFSGDPSAEYAFDNLGEMLGPMVLKLEVPERFHKNSYGGVRLGVASEGDMRDHAFDLKRIAAEMAVPTARILRQPVRNGFELAFGAVNDPSWGPAVVLGTGGRLIEVMDDTVTALAPIDRARAREMIKSLRSWPYLAEELQGAEAFEMLAGQLADFSAMVWDLRDDFTAIDLNPVIIEEDGRATPVDGLMMTTKERNDGA